MLCLGPFGKGESFTVSSDNTDKNPIGSGPSNTKDYNYKFRGYIAAVDAHYTWRSASRTFQGMSNSIFDGLLGSGGGTDPAGNTPTSGPGAGGMGLYAGYVISPTNGYITPGLFGGGGGACNATNTSNGTYGAAGSVGAGGGGAVCRSSLDPIGGMGGVGMVVVSILEYL